MPDPNDSKASAGDPLDAIIAEYVQQVEAGQVPDREALLAEHPDLAERLRSFFADFDRLDRQAADLRLSADPNRTTDATAPAAELPRVRYFGDYELLEVIARGGMGVVYKARQVSLNRMVALKMILKGELATARDVARFRAEAEAAANLDHPHIVPIYEVGEHDGQQYYAMRYVEGASLTRRPRADARKEASLVATVALAVHHAHQHGILHRDLKPSNILVDAAGTPLVADFGLAKRVDADRSLTESGALVGTPRYMAPEQAAGRKDLTVAADVYSLGVVLYERLTGQTPFPGETVPEILRQVQEMEPPRPSSMTPGLNRDLETICLKCLEKDPAKRYGSAEALADDLERWLRGEPIHARPVGQAERLWRWCRRNPTVAALTAAVAVSLLAATTIAILFAVNEAHNAESLRYKQKAADDARQDALREAAEKDRQARGAKRRTAELLFEQAYAKCRQEDAARGLLWLAGALQETAELDAPEVEQSIRLHLGAWGRDLHPLRGVVQVKIPILAYGRVAFSPNGKTILTTVALYGRNRAYPEKAQLWDAATSKPVGMPLQDVVQGAFSSDGKTVLTGSGDTARLWDAATGQPLGPPLQLPHGVFVLAFSPDGKTVLIGSGDTARLWDVATCQPLGPPLQHQRWVDAVAFSPDGKTVLTGSGDTARLWDVATGKARGAPMQLFGPDDKGLAFSPDSKTVLTRSTINTARLWEAATGKPIGPPLKHPDRVNAVAFSPDGKTVLTGSDDGTARLWDAATGEPFGLALHHPAGVNAVAFSPDGKTVLTGSGDNTARLWNAATGKPLGPPMQHQGEGNVYVVAFSANGKTVFTAGISNTWQDDWAASMGEARVWEVPTAEAQCPPLQHQDEVEAVAFSPDGKTVLTGSRENTARLWNAATGKPLGPPLKHKNWVRAVAFSPDGKTVLTGSSTAQLWDAATSKPLGPPLKHENWVVAVAFSPDGKTVLTGSYDGTARLWDAANGKPLGLAMEHLFQVAAVAFSPDGKTVLTGSWDNTARLWNAATGKPVGPPLKHPAGVNAVAFSPDGKTVLTGSDDGTARLWEAATGKPMGLTLQHPDRVNAAAFSPDGKTVLTGSDDGTARLWEAANGKPLGPPLQHQGAVVRVAFSPDGKAVLTGSVDHTARLWHVPSPLAGEPERILLWAQVITGMEVDHGTVRVLDSNTWEERRERLMKLGGPPVP
jgi:WD40 repeat protein/tRNA A-37 threonylcarbamoyl transferase component Bud32